MIKVVLTSAPHGDTVSVYTGMRLKSIYDHDRLVDLVLIGFEMKEVSFKHCNFKPTQQAGLNSLQLTPRNKMRHG